MLVDDNEVDRELLQPEIGVGQQDLPGDAQVRHVVDAQQQDRQVAGNALAPQARLRPAADPNALAIRAQRGAGEQQVSGKPLEQVGLGRGDAKVVQLHLRLGPGHHGRTVEGRYVPMPVDAGDDRIPGGCDHRPEHDPRHGARGHGHPAANGEHRVEHGANGAGQRVILVHGGRVTQVTAAADEAGAVRLDLWDAIGHGHVRGPNLRLRRRSPPPRRQQRAGFGQVFGFDEQLGESRVGDVGCLRRQRQFGIGGDVDRPGFGPVVGDGDPTHLGGFLGRQEHFHVRGKTAVTARKLGMVFVEDDVIRVGGDATGLRTGRPDPTAGDVAEVDEGAPVIQRRVLAPPRHGDIPPPAVARPSGGQHHGIAAVA